LNRLFCGHPGTGVPTMCLLRPLRWGTDCHNQSADWFRNDVEQRREQAPALQEMRNDIFPAGNMIYALRHIVVSASADGFYMRAINDRPYNSWVATAGASPRPTFCMIKAVERSTAFIIFPVCPPGRGTGSLHRHTPVGCPPARRRQGVSPSLPWGGADGRCTWQLPPLPYPGWLP